jgi:DNA-binding FadR family transcriptional regulator
MKDGEAGELDDTVAADLRFHRAVPRAANNRYLEIVLDPLASFSMGWELHRNIL